MTGVEPTAVMSARCCGLRLKEPNRVGAVGQDSCQVKGNFSVSPDDRDI